MIKFSEYLTESRRRGNTYELYHDSYSSAVQTARLDAEKQGYTIDEDSWHNVVATGPRKPSAGKTNSMNIDLLKNGKSVRERLNIQVYNRGTNDKTFELNYYIT